MESKVNNSESRTVPVMPVQDFYAGEKIDHKEQAPVHVSATTKNSKKHVSFGRLILGLFALAIVGGLIYLGTIQIKSSSKVVDINECIDISFAGYSGNGVVICSTNPNALKRQIEDAVGKEIDSDEVKWMADMIDTNIILKSKAQHADNDESGLAKVNEENTDEFSPDDLEHLCIGDTIEVTVSYVDLQQRYPEIEFTGKSFDVVVNDGLKEYAELDPFKYIVIGYEGISPFGKFSQDNSTVKSECPEEYLPFLSLKYFSLDKSKDLAVGETIHVKYNEEGQIKMRESGYKAARTEMDVVIGKEEMDRYITDISELDKASFADIEQQAMDIACAYCVRKSIDPTTVEYQASYLLIPKDDFWNSGYFSDCVTASVLFFKAQVVGLEQTPKDVWLSVVTSGLYLEKGNAEEPQSVIYNVSNFSDASSYESQIEAENQELIARSGYNSIKIDIPVD